MINRRTVLVLGAGASMPYGFPSGAGLREIICGEGNNSQAVQRGLIAAGYDEDHLRLFITALRNSGRQSVDAFLEHRRDFLGIGKAAIAVALIPYEVPRDLQVDVGLHGRWYAHLFDQLEASPDQWRRNALTIVTYNYDRSLEFFLWKALENSFGMTPEDAGELLEAIPILHLHGCLAPLGPNLLTERPYSPEVRSGSVRTAAESIKVIGEATPTDAVFAQARGALSAAERVYFLGFGYHPTNLGRLGRDLFRHTQTICGTCVGMGEGERGSAVGWFRNGLELPGPQHNSLDLLRHYPPLRD